MSPGMDTSSLDHKKQQRDSPINNSPTMMSISAVFPDNNSIMGGRDISFHKRHSAEPAPNISMMHPDSNSDFPTFPPKVTLHNVSILMYICTCIETYRPTE
jgi:hypothetical protein